MGSSLTKNIRRMHPYSQTQEKSSYGEAKNSCKLCGKTREWHVEQLIKSLQQERPAELEAKEWLIANGFANHPFYPSGLYLLTKFVEDQRRRLKE